MDFDSDSGSPELGVTASYGVAGLGDNPVVHINLRGYKIVVSEADARALVQQINAALPQKD